MDLRIFLFCVIFYARDSAQECEGNSSNPIWPTKYTVRGLKINLKADLVQDFQFWKNEHSSRMDYNHGTSKTFRYDETIVKKYGATYKVHPQTDEYEINKIVCTWTRGTSSDEVTPEDILPDAEYYDFVGKETLLDKEASKFFYQVEDQDDNTDTRTTLWAYQDNSTSWIPLRYEVMEFNTWYGNLKKHNIWLFYNTELDYNSFLLNATKYADDCEESDEVEDEDKNSVEIFLNPKREDHIAHAFDSFKRRYQREYPVGETDHDIKKEIFQKNLELVISTNNQNLGYKLAINHLADHTPEQMKKRMGLKRTLREKGNVPFPYTLEQMSDETNDLPKEYDLRLLGYVSSVKEQVDCGCCWTMGTTAAVEGALARSNGGRLLSLSNQALIDCSWGFGEAGCDGGTDTAAYKWMMEYGLPTVEEYGTYDDTDGYCKIENMTKLYPIRGFTDVTPYSVEALKWALINHGPLSVSVHASTPAFGLYASGIFYDPLCSSTALDHEVSLVGYGEADGEPFWIIKNSWGPDWGIAGFMHISMRDNNCGVATEPTYVVF